METGPDTDTLEFKPDPLGLRRLCFILLRSCPAIAARCERPSSPTKMFHLRVSVPQVPRERTSRRSRWSRWATCASGCWKTTRRRSGRSTNRSSTQSSQVTQKGGLPDSEPIVSAAPVAVVTSYLFIVSGPEKCHKGNRKFLGLFFSNAVFFSFFFLQNNMSPLWNSHKIRSCEDMEPGLLVVSLPSRVFG